MLKQIEKLERTQSIAQLRGSHQTKVQEGKAAILREDQVACVRICLQSGVPKPSETSVSEQLKLIEALRSRSLRLPREQSRWRPRKTHKPPMRWKENMNLEKAPSKKKSGPAEIHLKAIGHCQSIAHVGPHSCLTRLHSHVLRHSEKMCVQTAKRNCHILLHRQTSSPKITKIIQLGKWQCNLVRVQHGAAMYCWCLRSGPPSSFVLPHSLSLEVCAHGSIPRSLDVLDKKW